MTYEERERIFSKDVLSLDDLANVLNLSKSEACQQMKRIKLLSGDRLGVKGKLHVTDYLVWAGIPKESLAARYTDAERSDESAGNNRTAQNAPRMAFLSQPRNRCF